MPAKRTLTMRQLRQVLRLAGAGTSAREIGRLTGVARSTVQDVRFAQTCILGRLRHQRFFSLAEANAAIAGALDRINNHPIRRLGVTRRQLFETVERAELMAVPAQDYEYAEWRLARAGADYHVEFERFFYSVPYGLIREQVDVRAVKRRAIGVLTQS